MSSLLNNASLLLNPAGSVISYKEDKIYSVIPRNGAGDFTFTGGNGGTRVNQQGYVEVTPANVVSYSSDLSNAYWTKRGFAQLSTTETAPDGSPTAYKVQENNTDNNPGVVVIPTITPVGTYTFYVWLKADANVSFALSTVGNAVGTTINVTTSWQLFQVTQTLSSPANGPHIGGFSTIPRGSGIVLYIWHPQLNIGSTAKPYQPTTDRLNYPRITYQNGRGALLSEPQRTNKQTSSESINGTDYSNNNQITISSDFGTSPDGTQNADKIIATTTNDYHQIRTNKATPNGYDIISCFVKASGYNFVQLMSWADPADYVNFDLQNGTVGTVSTATIYGIENFGNGWYRIYANVKGSGSGLVGIGIITSATAGWSQAFAGNSTDGILVWGVQIEVGSYPTSYIPTTSATVTRPGDVTTKTGASSVINASEGTIYVDFIFGDNDTGGSDQNLTMLYSGGYSNSVFFACYGSTIKRLYGWITNGATQVAIQSPTLYKGQRVKAALTYKNNDYIMYVNGVSAGTQAQPVPSLDTIIVGNQIGGTAQAPNPLATTALFNTRLTNTQLAELTTVRSGSGGNISYYGPYTTHTFTGSATFTPSFNGEVEVLVVAGGGSGGGQGFNDGSGGGGAGGLLYASSYGVSAGTGITVTIGAGGAGVSAATTGNDGSNSVFGGLTAIGGGGGGSEASVAARFGRPGGSGGGAGGYSSNYLGGAGITGQGNKGGDNKQTGGSGINYGGGGGGGAGAPGQDGNNTVVGQLGLGGDGLPYSISGFSTYYAGGGGCGGGYSATGSAGGLGGGGKGGDSATGRAAGTSGVNYTGGGGGGAGGSAVGGSGNSGTGGAGVVIVRYLT